MGKLETLRARREAVLREIGELEQIRRGSVTEQYYERTQKDGTKRRYGPYGLYTCKRESKTHSRRLPDPRLVEIYRSQTEAFHRLQELTAELVRIGEQISDLALSEGGVKKTSKRKSRSKRTRKSSAS